MGGELMEPRGESNLGLPGPCNRGRRHVLLALADPGTDTWAVLVAPRRLTQLTT